MDAKANSEMMSIPLEKVKFGENTIKTKNNCLHLVHVKMIHNNPLYTSCI